MLKFYLKGIMLEDTLRKINGEKLPHIIPAVAKCHLCKVVRPKREEFSLLCYLSDCETKTTRTMSDFKLEDSTLLFALEKFVPSLTSHVFK